MKRETVFIPVSDMDWYCDWDHRYGYGGTDQLDYPDGILVRKERERDFREHVAKFEAHKTEQE